MTKIITTILFLNLICVSFTYAKSEAWVNVDRLNRRNCPAQFCDIVGTLMYRERVDIYEELDGWVRITPNNYKAQWVLAKHLSSTRPE